jgi:membrane protease YdiL (CAAX protease family)
MVTSGLAAESRPTPVAERPTVWRRILPFVGLTFGLTWLLDLALLLTGGYGQPQTLVALQLQMLIPAACAITLGFGSSRFGPRRIRESAGRARAFFRAFQGFTLAYAAIAAAALIAPGLSATMTLAGAALTLVGAIALVCLRVAGGRESFARAGLTFGRPLHWTVFGTGLALLYAAESALNAAFGLGARPDAGVGMSGSILILVGVGAVVVDPFVGIVVAFGEEYGWRGFMQGELVALGRVRGVLAVGVVWGLWHAPLIAMGHNYPGRPVAGIPLMVAFTTLLAFVLGYAVLKTGSVWLAAFLHALNNSVSSFFTSAVYSPDDPVYQFAGGGLYGLALLAVVVWLLLRDPVWRADAGAA